MCSRSAGCQRLALPNDPLRGFLKMSVYYSDISLELVSIPGALRDLRRSEYYGLASEIADGL